MPANLKQYIILTGIFCFSTAIIAAPQFLRSTEELFAHPHDLVLDPSNRWLFVADVNHHDIKILDAKSLEIVKAFGTGELDSPHDVHFNAEGRLLVADSGNDRIAIYEIKNLDASFIGELNSKMKSPEGVTSSEGGYIYVASTGNHKVLKFHRGKLLKSVGERGDGKLEFVRPHDIELGKDGLLYVGDPGNQRVQVLNSSLGFNSNIEVRSQPFVEPKYLALDENNWLFVADQHNNRLRIFNSTRQEVGSITQAGNKSLNYIEGVEVTNGMIWISDTYNNRIVLFRWSR